MLPFAAHPLAHCSTTLTRSRVGLGSRSKLPTPKKTPPYPASRSTRSVGGDNHVTWVTSKRRPSTPTASGDTRCVLIRRALHQYTSDRGPARSSSHSL